MAFVKKEFLHILRDYRTLIIIFGLPAAQILIFGYVVSTDIHNAGIAILDFSKDEVTNNLTDKLASSGFFRINATLNSYNDIDAILKKGKIREVIVFENDFAAKLTHEGRADVLIVADGSEPNVANLVTNYTISIINTFSASLNKGQTGLTGVITPEVKMYFNPRLESQFMFVPGVITLILILICALMTSVTITREKELGTMEVLLVSPLKPWQIILGKVAPYFLLSIVNVVVILLMAWFVFRLPVAGSIALLIGECMLYILMALSLGILISTMANDMQTAIFISLIGLMMPSLLLSGFIFPIENMPKIYDYLSLFMPPRWFVTIIRGVMVKGVGLAYIWKETLILAGMTTLFIMLSAKRFKERL